MEMGDSICVDQVHGINAAMLIHGRHPSARYISLWSGMEPSLCRRVLADFP